MNDNLFDKFMENSISDIDYPRKTVTAQEFYEGVTKTPEEFYNKTMNPELVGKTEELIGIFGDDMKLEEVKKHLLGNKVYRCPKCHGKGYTVEEYNAYPTNLPDSGWVYEAGYRNIPCDLCNSQGWLEKEMKPKYKQVLDGYECVQ